MLTKSTGLDQVAEARNATDSATDAMLNALRRPFTFS